MGEQGPDLSAREGFAEGGHRRGEALGDHAVDAGPHGVATEEEAQAADRRRPNFGGRGAAVALTVASGGAFADDPSGSPASRARTASGLLFSVVACQSNQPSPRWASSAGSVRATGFCAAQAAASIPQRAAIEARGQAGIRICRGCQSALSHPAPTMVPARDWKKLNKKLNARPHGEARDHGKDAAGGHHRSSGGTLALADDA